MTSHNRITLELGQKHRTFKKKKKNIGRKNSILTNGMLSKIETEMQQDIYFCLII